MKPLKGDLQLRFVSLSYSVALQALEPKSSPRRRRGLDASTDRGLPESSGEVFLLDILSHRMSVIAIYRQQSTRMARSRSVLLRFCQRKLSMPSPKANILVVFLR